VAEKARIVVKKNLIVIWLSEELYGGGKVGQILLAQKRLILTWH
jgi:hypothetical protein